MPKFIKLTQPDGDPLLINLSAVAAFSKLTEEGTAIFELGREARSFAVTETIPEILALIEKP